LGFRFSVFGFGSSDFANDVRVSIQVARGDGW
jgi:hypothetical protein